MPTEQTEQATVSINKDTLLNLIATLAGRGVGTDAGREDDEHPLPPGPWDPVIRAALRHIGVFGPRPEPWRVFGSHARTIGHTPGDPVPWRVVLAHLLVRHPEIDDAIGGGGRFAEEVALNPQPLPPRLAFLTELAQTVIARAGLLHELAQFGSGESERGIIIVSGYLSSFCDELCPRPFRLKWPFPGPRPNWFTEELDGLDLIWTAAQFHQAAKEAYFPESRLALDNAGARFLEAGVSRLQ